MGAIGLDGDTNVPNGHSIHYVAGFKVHCSDNNYDTSETTNHITNDKSVPFNFKLHKPMRKMFGCVNTPLYLPDTDKASYWASDCTISSSDDDKYVIEPVSPDGCGTKDVGVQYHLDCGDGLVMQRFTGQSDVPTGHKVSYIAKMDITCV